MYGYAALVNGGRSRRETMGDMADDVLEWGRAILFPGAYAAEQVLDTAGPIVAPSVFPAVDSGSKAASVTAPSGLKLRAQPSENAAQVALLPKGAVVTVLETGFSSTPAAPKGWTKVRTASGSEGFVSTEWLSISSPTSASSGNTSSALALTNASTSSASGESSKLPWIAGGVAVLVLGIGLAVGLSGDGKKRENPGRRRRRRGRARRSRR